MVRSIGQADIEVPELRGKVHRYTPLSKRQDRPNAISWLIRYQAELTDAQIAKLIGTTKPTIQSVRDRSHWNMSNIKPLDPVTLGLCSQVDLDEAVRTAQAREERKRLREEKVATKAKAAQLAAAEAAGAPSTQPVPETPATEGEVDVPAAPEGEAPEDEVEVPTETVAAPDPATPESEAPAVAVDETR